MGAGCIFWQNQISVNRPWTLCTLYFVESSLVFKIVLTLSRARVHFLLSPSLAVITENHKLYTWGCGAHCQLGQFSEDTECPPDVLVPTQVKGSYPLCLEGKDFMTVSCGVNHTAAIHRNGKIHTFGNGADGRLGLHTVWAPRSSPAKCSTSLLRSGVFAWPVAGRTR